MVRIMSSPGSMTGCAEDLGSPDPAVRDAAARRIWEHYSSRLMVLVRRNLDARIRRREGEGDVLQSMYRSFCEGRREGKLPLASRDDLWRILVHITMCKVRNAAKHHLAARRDHRREEADPGEVAGWMLARMDNSAPTPEEAAILEEEMSRWLEPLNEDQRQLALWKLDGYTNKEIGVMISRTERSVELKMGVIRGKLESRFTRLEGADEA
jgi:hypothetical protein